MKSKRHYKRYLSDIPISYRLNDVSGDSYEYLLNIGAGGLCFRSRAALPKGSLIDIEIPVNRPALRATGVVVWCREQEPDYEVGVQFQDAGTRFTRRMVEQVCQIEQYKHRVLEQDGRSISGEEAALEWISRHGNELPPW